MSFEQDLRDRINKAAHQSAERNLLKVVLGEVQQKSLTGDFTDEMGHGIVRKMIKANQENIELLGDSDPRTAVFVEENVILSSLLPKYWSEDEIRQRLESDRVDILGAKNDGQATGLAMQHLKKLNAPVDGQTVRQAVTGMRNSS